MARFLVAAIVSSGCSVASAQWTPQAVATDADFRGLSAVSAKVAWVSGTNGTVGRTVDGGATWAVMTVPGAEALDFRDIEAFDADTAYAMSAGLGPASRLYKTADGGKTWALQFTAADPAAFLDAVGFWDAVHGIALGDPVDGRFQLVVTADGKTWTPLPAASLPVALPNEGCFAASGTCLVTSGKSDVWFCTGGAKAARVFYSADRGKTWAVAETPLLAGTASAGGFTLAFDDRGHGVLVGGDYRQPDAAVATAAVTTDRGKTWTLAEKLPPFRSGVSRRGADWIAVGTSGSDRSADGGKTWTRLDGGAFNAVAFTPAGAGWAVGPKGRVARFTPAKGRRLPPAPPPGAPIDSR